MNATRSSYHHQMPFMRGIVQRIAPRPTGERMTRNELGVVGILGLLSIAFAMLVIGSLIDGAWIASAAFAVPMIVIGWAARVIRRDELLK